MANHNRETVEKSGFLPCSAGETGSSNHTSPRSPTFPWFSALLICILVYYVGDWLYVGINLGPGPSR